ncbi:MAG: hypothetical protein E7588_00430 [Ruminococcaceae bacterium]|nr:hypothetical protein [Oscillospiraceae bacterium]
MSNYKNKSGTAEYTVIADTHGYITGCLEADFDLGDNTNSGVNMYEPIQHTKASKMTLLGNHDVAQMMHESGMYVEKTDAEITVPYEKEWIGVQEYADNDKKILFIGLETAKSFHSYTVPSVQISHLAKRMSELEEDWDIAILTHIPLFPPRTVSGNSWDDRMERRWDRIDDSLRNTDADTRSNHMKTPREIVKLLSAFQTKSTVIYNGATYDYSKKTSNNVIGCFCGHVHNSIRCAVSLCDFPGYTEYTDANRKKIYMEAFRTNGSAEYAPQSMANAGMYIPEPSPCRIIIDFDNCTVNGTSYISPAVSSDYAVENHNSGHPFSVLAKGQYKLSETSEMYPKFYEGQCIGWGLKPESGATRYGDNIHNVNGIHIEGIEGVVDKIRFSASGLLKYYITTDSPTQKTIPDYDTVTLHFTTDNGVKWHFRGGKLVECKQ